LGWPNGGRPQAKRWIATALALCRDVQEPSATPLEKSHCRTIVVGVSVTALLLSIIGEMRFMLSAGTAEGGIR
jgi:hypothetical protein